MTPRAEQMNRNQADGVCRVCRGELVPGTKLCRRHLDEANERRMRDYEKRKKNGLCVQNGCNKMSTADNMRCKTHARTEQVYQRDYKSRKRMEKRKKGECTIIGCTRPTAGLIRCDECNRKNREYLRDYRARKRVR